MGNFPAGSVGPFITLPTPFSPQDEGCWDGC